MGVATLPSGRSNARPARIGRASVAGFGTNMPVMVTYVGGALSKSRAPLPIDESVGTSKHGSTECMRDWDEYIVRDIGPPRAAA